MAGLIAIGRTPERWAFLLMGLWLAVRTPAGAGLGLGSLFSPATFFRPILGPLSSSAGVLALTGGIATLAGISLWYRGGPRRKWSIALGAGLLVVAPYLNVIGNPKRDPVRDVTDLAPLTRIWRIARAH